MSESLLERARAWRELVLLAEMAGWLHDLGKLSGQFVISKTDRAYNAPRREESSQGEELASGGDDRAWSHAKIFEYDASHIPAALAEALARPLSPAEEGAEAWVDVRNLPTAGVSLRDLVSGHHREARGDLELLFHRADGDESGEDEHSAGAAQTLPVQAATAFGRERPLADGDLSALDAARLALYEPLRALLTGPGSSAERREEVWRLLSEAMQKGLGKTQRAANDIRLDQHAWGVASRFKAYLLRDLLAGQATGAATFRLLSVQWDAWEQIAPHARLSDVVGRAVMLAGVRAEVRRVLEDEHALGNRVYEDADGVHLLVADAEWGQELSALVREAVNRASEGEVQPVVRLSEPTRYVTDLVAQMEAARREVPLVGTPRWLEQWGKASNGKVCPVCQKRPLQGEAELCPTCERWRRRGIERRRALGGTLWTGEIADRTGRVALVAAQFDLSRWLDGTMLHTLFITSPQDIAQAAKLDGSTVGWVDAHEAIANRDRAQDAYRQWRPLMKKRKDIVGKLERVERRLANVQSNPRIPDERKSELLSTYGSQQRDLNAQLAQLDAQLRDPQTWFVGAVERYITSGPGGPDRQARIEREADRLGKRYTDLDDRAATLLALARKNPCAGRLLRVWQGTEAFLQACAEWVGDGAPERQRACWTLRRSVASGVYQVDLPGLGPSDVFVRPDHGRMQTITSLDHGAVERLCRATAGRTLRLRAADGEMVKVEVGQAEAEPYRAYQVVLSSPILLLAMVPADRALAAAEEMQRAYAAEFGAVQNRLPLRVGLVYMDAHYPMFAALDAARRLLETLDALGREPIQASLTAVEQEEGHYRLEVESARHGRWTWRVPAVRGDGQTDWYHPYFWVRDGADAEQRGMSLAGPYGRWVHVSQLAPGDRIGLWPNLFDTLYLDTATRRFDARAAPETGRRPHPLLGAHHSTRPYLLERVHCLRAVWDAVRTVAGISETRLAAVEGLLSRKWRDWRLEQPADDPQRAGHHAAYVWLAEQVVARDLGKSSVLQEAILDGTFFDAVELYRHILKAPLSEDAATVEHGEEGDR